MYQEIKNVIKDRNNQFFSFSYATQLLLKSWSVTTVAEKALYTCINGFCQNAINYALSVEEDLYHKEYNFMPKSMMNRLLLRNCLEASLVITVLEEHPEYSEKYYATKTDDSERIDALYSNQENEKRFLKRFEWLPRFKGKKATSTKDLLKYIRFEDDEEVEYIETLIKNLDTFIHPSFHYAQNLHNPAASKDVSTIHALYVEEALIDELKRNMYNVIKGLKIFPNYVEEIRKEYRIEDYIKQNHHKIPSGIPISIINIANFLRWSDFTTFKGKGTVYLLQDFAPRYDDLLQSALSNNPLLFFIQSRYIIESLATINVLMDEDEKRNEIYHIHQDIKNFEAQQSSQAFLKIENDAAVRNEKNVALIKEYYRNYFNAEIDDNKITRLSGWALFLKNLNNPEPINSPNFVTMLGQTVFSDEEIIRKLSVFYEESNAYTHITPYAFSKDSSPLNILEVLILINELLTYVIEKIMKVFALIVKLHPDQQKDLKISLFDGIKKLNIELKNYSRHS